VNVYVCVYYVSVCMCVYERERESARARARARACACVHACVSIIHLELTFGIFVAAVHWGREDIVDIETILVCLV